MTSETQSDWLVELYRISRYLIPRIELSNLFPKLALGFYTRDLKFTTLLHFLIKSGLILSEVAACIYTKQLSNISPTWLRTWDNSTSALNFTSFVFSESH
jgi:hypothetical protein